MSDEVHYSSASAIDTIMSIIAGMALAAGHVGGVRASRQRISNPVQP